MLKTANVSASVFFRLVVAICRLLERYLKEYIVYNRIGFGVESH
jgi:hypothetical protein